MRGTTIVSLEPNDRIILTIAKSDKTNDGHIQIRPGMHSKLEVEEI